MTTSTVSEESKVFSLSIYDSGRTEVSIGNLCKSISYTDAITVLENAIPELSALKALQTETELKTQYFSKYIVKYVLDREGYYRFLLYSPSKRADYLQKWKTSGEQNLEAIKCLMSFLKDSYGAKAVVDSFLNRGIAIDEEDDCIWYVRSYLYPSIICDLKMADIGNGSLGYRDALYKATFSKRDELLKVIHPHEDTKSFSMPLPNFFSHLSMCFGSVDRQTTYDIKSHGYAQLDFFMDVIYSTYFNTDLTPNLPITSQSYDTKTEAAADRLSKLLTLGRDDLDVTTVYREILEHLDTEFNSDDDEIEVLNSILYFTSPEASYDYANH